MNSLYSVILDFFQSFQSFHFLTPFWFLAILFLIFVFLYKGTIWLKKTDFNQVCDAHLVKFLTKKPNSINQFNHSLTANLKKKNNWFKQTYSHKLGLALISLLVIASLAAPVWQKLPTPIFDRGYLSLVIVLDLSQSMNAKDISPSRLKRAKFKIKEILKIAKNRQQILENLAKSKKIQALPPLKIGLVVYTNQAYVVSPVTSNTESLNSLVDVLNTDLMPSFGSRLQSGLDKANQLLNQAGIKRGNILVLTDSVKSVNFSKVRKIAQNHKIHLIAMGTEQGSIIPAKNGNAMTDSSGNVIISRISPNLMQAFSRVSGGTFQKVQFDNKDINYLISNLQNSTNKQQKVSSGNADTYRQEYYWFLLLAMAIFLTYFRKGNFILLAIPFLFSPLSLKAETKFKQGSEHKQSQNYLYSNDWNAQKKFESGNFNAAENQFKNLRWKASSFYKNKDYQKALNIWKNFNTANDFYNQGNAYAKLEKYKKAVESYDRAIKLNKKHYKAIENRKRVLDFIKQKQKQKQKQKKNKNNQGKKQSKQGKSKQGQSGGNQGKNQSKQGKSKQGQSGGNQGKNQKNSSNQSDKNNKSKKQNQAKSGQGKGKGSKQKNQQGSKQGNKQGSKQKNQQANQGQKGQKRGENGNKNKKNQQGSNSRKNNNQATKQKQLSQNKQSKQNGQKNQQNKIQGNKNQQSSSSKLAQSGGAGNPNDINKKVGNQKINQDPLAKSGKNKNNQKQNKKRKIKNSKTGIINKQSRSKEKGKPSNQTVISPVIQPQLSEKQIYIKQQLQQIKDDPGELLRRKFLYQYRKNKITPDLLTKPY